MRPLDLPSELEPAVDLVRRSFVADPLWSAVFPSTAEVSAAATAFWRVVVTGALRYPWTMTNAEMSALIVWIPPGQPEWGEEGIRELHRIRTSMPEQSRRQLDKLFAVLSANHPESGPDGELLAYLSVAAVDPRLRGHGRGGELLDESLVRVDDAAWAAYLESSNPRNITFYERRGFRVRQRFAGPGGAVITTMMRPAQRR